MKKIIIIVCMAVFFVMAVSGCGSDGAGGTSTSQDSANSEAAVDDGKLNVVATIFPEYDFARAISGGNADVHLLIAPGTSVHSFDPSPNDIKTIAAADIFIFVGGESDEWVDRILESIDAPEMKVVRLMDYVDAVEEELKEGMEPEEEDAAGDGDDSSEETEYDEHIWVSPKNALALLDAIAVAMCEKDSANETSYLENAAAYKAELAEVDAEIDEVVSSAARNKIVVADKFPFRYFADQYGLDYVAAFPGCSDQADASAQTIAYLIDTVMDEKIPYVYYVELSNQNVADAVAEQTGAGTLLLNSCENITKDDFDKGITYVDLMRANAENLKKGLN